MDPPPTQYVERDGAALAYQHFGKGPVNVVWALEIVNHLDLMWTDPDLHHNVEESASWSQGVMFQPRGFGLSDQIPYAPTIEQQADDVLAVMDAVGMRRATLFGYITTCGAVALAAARAPERVDALVLVNALAQGPQSSDETKHGWTEAEFSAYIDGFRHAFTNWGSGATLDMYDPVLVTPYNRRLMAMLERSSATPSTAQAYFESLLSLDVQDVFRSIQVPVRVLHIPSSPVPEAAARHVAELAPLGTFIRLPATPKGASMGHALIPALRHVEEVATGASHSAEADRFLGTVLFTDVVSSTELLTQVGDAEYRDLRSAHERLVRLAVETRGGRLLTVTGDGTLSVFDGPSQAVRCAEIICREAKESGITVRAGIHTGELERDGMNVTGLSVHIGARVGAAADPGQVLVSRTVHDLVGGSGLTFVSRGEHELKGVPGHWELYAVTHAGQQSSDLPPEESMQTPMDKLALRTAQNAPGLARAVVRLGNALERRRARAGS
jgi:class 3 adenylate cyclase/pimeloyl-ACP methyl ester carboxylesterase